MPVSLRDERFYAVIAVFLGALLAIGLFVVVDYEFMQKFVLGSLYDATNYCIVPHPKRNHAFRPNCETAFQWGRARNKFSVNDLGFRDASIRVVPKDSGKPRILFLGDSFTAGITEWNDTFVARFAQAFPQWDIINGGIYSYAPSTYYLVAKEVLEKGYRVDEVVVDFDISDIQDEASIYVDTGPDSVDVMPERQTTIWPYTVFRDWIRTHLVLTDIIMAGAEKLAVSFGYYHLSSAPFNNIFDSPRSAWTYRAVDDTRWKEDGYAPLGKQGGIEKAKLKMDALYNLLAARGIPLTMVVYPWPAQLAHDKEESYGVTLWRNWCQMDSPAPKCKRFITAYPAFFAVKNACPALMPGCWYTRLFVFRDDHYNAAGNALMADQLIKSFQDKPLP